MSAVRRIALRIQGQQDVTFQYCDDCPCYRDPDPRPGYCVLADVRPGGRIPDDCPLCTLAISVTHGETPERDEPLPEYLLEAERDAAEVQAAWVEHQARNVQRLEAVGSYPPGGLYDAPLGGVPGVRSWRLGGPMRVPGGHDTLSILLELDFGFSVETLVTAMREGYVISAWLRDARGVVVLEAGVERVDPALGMFESLAHVRTWLTAWTEFENEVRP